MIVATIAGAAAGAAGIGLIALIQIELASDSPAPASMVWAFAALCVMSAMARVIGQIGMVRLGQRAVSELSLQIVVGALDCPCGRSRRSTRQALLAVLTEDIILIANALVGVPHLCINAPILDRLPDLHRLALAADLVCGVFFAAPAIAVYVVLSSMRREEAAPGAGRQDVLVGHFRTLIGGFRELKLHRGRRELISPDRSSPPWRGPQGYGPAALPTSPSPKAGASSRFSASSASCSSSSLESSRSTGRRWSPPS